MSKPIRVKSVKTTMRIPCFETNMYKIYLELFHPVTFPTCVPKSRCPSPSRMWGFQRRPLKNTLRADEKV